MEPLAPSYFELDTSVNSLPKTSAGLTNVSLTLICKCTWTPASTSLNEVDALAKTSPQRTRSPSFTKTSVVEE